MNTAIQNLVKINNAMMDSNFNLLMEARADLDELYPHSIDKAEYNILVNHIEDLKLIFNS